MLHEYESGGAPPLTPTTIEPSLVPKHEALVIDMIESLMAAGWVIVTVTVVVHPLLSVTVHVYVPAERPLAVAALPPDGDHEYV